MSAKPLPPPPAPRARGPVPATKPPEAAPAQPAPGQFPITTGKLNAAQRVELYGPGGVGKTTLAALAPGSIVVDLEGGSNEIDVPRVQGIESWDDLRGWLRSSAPEEYQTIIIDSVTKAEEFAVAHTLATVPHEKGNFVNSVEGYGFGKGYQHVYETFLHLLVECDRHIRAGRNVILIAHDCVNDVPNPTGEDFIRYEPRLQQPKSGKASIRERVFEWCDHVLFLGYDVVSNDGKGKGGGTRTIWPVERPDHRAKSRRIVEPMPFESAEDGAIWPLILNGGGR